MIFLGFSNFLRKIVGKKPGKCAAVIVAAGSSSRMKGINKLLAELDGKPVIHHTLEAFQECDMISQIIVVTKEDMVAYLTQLCKANDFTKVSDITVGGAERIDSVMIGLTFAGKDIRLAAIHDGARPLITVEQIETALFKAAETGAAAPAIPVKDTIKTAFQGAVLNTPDRSTLFAVQTPQVFDIDLLRGALQKAKDTKSPVTDDCSAVEQLGMKVHLTEGSEENIKITTPLDLMLAEAILLGRNKK